MKIAGILDYDGNQYRSEWTELHNNMRNLHTNAVMMIGMDQLKILNESEKK